VGFFTLREAEGDMFKLYVDRFQMAPLEAYKRSLICGFLLDELASKRLCECQVVGHYHHDNEMVVERKKGQHHK